MIARRLLAGGLLAASFAAHAEGARCELARDTDFAGDGRRRLEAYLEELARASGDPYGIQPKEFHLLVSNAAPPVVDGSPAEGEIGCSWGKRYVFLYKRVLANRSLAATYNTIAYQYFRHVQVRRDGAKCDSSDDGAMLRSEAKEWARKIAPACP